MRLAIDPAMLAARPPAEALRAAVAAGFDAIELGSRPDVVPAFGPPAMPVRALLELAASASGMGLAVASVAVIQTWSSPDEAERRRAVGWWRAGIAAAAALGAPRINTELAGDPERPEACRDAFLRSFGELLPDLRDADLTVAVEPHPNDFVETTAAALEVVRAVRDPRLRYLHCVPHAFHLGGSPAAQVRLAGPGLDHVHLADSYRPERTILNPASPRVRVHQHLEPGQGEIDLSDVAAELGRAGFDGLLTLQVFAWPDRAEASFAAGRRTVEAFARKIATARSGHSEGGTAT